MANEKHREHPHKQGSLDSLLLNSQQPEFCGMFVHLPWSFDLPVEQLGTICYHPSHSPEGWQGPPTKHWDWSKLPQNATDKTLKCTFKFIRFIIQCTTLFAGLYWKMSQCLPLTAPGRKQSSLQWTLFHREHLLHKRHLFWSNLYFSSISSSSFPSAFLVHSLIGSGKRQRLNISQSSNEGATFWN